MSIEEISATPSGDPSAPLADHPAAFRPVRPALRFGLRSAILAGLILSPAALVTGQAALSESPIGIAAEINTTCCPEGETP